MESAKSFEAKFDRIMQATGADGPSALAKILDIHPSSVGAAKKRKQIPSGWVEQIADKYSVNANWLFFGIGSMRMDEAAEDAPPNQNGPCARCERLEADNRELVRDNRELVSDNRELMKENRELMRENGDLRVELERMKARAAPDQETPNEAHRKAG